MQSKKRAEPPKLSFIEEARRRQIIEAAIVSIAAEGYAGASLAKVAARAEISKSVVVYYFGGKDELLETTIQQIFGEIRDFLRPRLDAVGTAREQLRAYIESEFAFLEQHRPRLLAISYILTNHRDARGRFYLREDAEVTYLEFARKLLEKGQKTGEFRAFAVKPMAMTLMHAINGALSAWVADPKLSLSDYALELVAIFDLATRKTPVTAARRS